MYTKFKHEILDSGIDIIIVLIIIMFIGQTYINLAGMLMLYIVVRSLFVKALTIVLSISFFLFLSILVFAKTAEFSSEAYIALFISFIVITLILVIIQLVKSLVHAFTDKNEEPLKSKKKLLNLLFKLINWLEHLFYVFRVVVGIFYPILITIVIILSFAALNSAINGYYDGEGLEKGIYESYSQERLEIINDTTSLSVEDYLLELNEKGYIYFSAVTYFTIGYGDYVPKGSIIKNVAMIEMIIAHFMNLSVFAIYSNLIYKLIIKGSTRKKETSDKVDRTPEALILVKDEKCNGYEI